jgi:hypothetical protein
LAVVVVLQLLLRLLLALVGESHVGLLLGMVAVILSVTQIVCASSLLVMTVLAV